MMGLMDWLVCFRDVCRSLQQRALKRITKYCSESVANAVPEWVVDMVVTLEKEQQTEIERRDESYQNVKAQLENEREHHSKTKEQMQTTSDEAASERAAKEEALKEKKSLQEQLEAERSARQDAERASSAAVEECASMRDELHKLRTEKHRVEVIRAVRGYNTRRRLKDSRMGERELRQQCSKLSAQLDCSRASLRQLESAQKGKQQVVIAADKGTRPARSA
jgi:chromosome segregation ATPase